MRISTANSYEAAIDNLQRRQAAMSDLQTRMTSGKRLLKASDDPAAASRAERALASEMRSTTSQRSVEASRVVATQTESALGDAEELLQQAREALVATGNATFSNGERKVQAEKLDSLRQALLAVANRSDGAGSYLFGGQGSTQPPFVDAPAPTGVQFLGVGGQVRTDADTLLPLSTDGAEAWLNARSGNGVFVTSSASNSVNGASVTGAWVNAGSVTDPSSLFPVAATGYRIHFTSSTAYDVESFPLATPSVVTTESSGNAYQDGRAIQLHGMSVNVAGSPINGDQFEIQPSTPSRSVFGALDDAIAALRLPNQTGAQRAQATADSLRDVDAVMIPLRSVRSAAGDVLNRIDNEDTRLSAQKLNAQTERASAEDLDMVQAYSDFSNQQTGYDAALKSYSLVQKMSLFQYLNP
ncbi:MAG: flagellar hook-associated protein FlgL [Pseudomonadota bacterium]|nr:flagellar hook-associated protein FlgL [Pseudomonadota bacterium]